MEKRIVITGATGLIGRKVCRQLSEKGHKLVVFTRSPYKARNIINSSAEFVEWDYKNIDSWKDHLCAADSIIHLAGESVMGGRWTDEHKKRVYNSRIKSTNAIVDAISRCNVKPESFVCASAVGFYDDSIDKVFDENAEQGKGFLAKVTADWEKAAAAVEEFGVRRVSIRIGIVLDQNGGALEKMITPFRFFIGGPLGSGKQWFPWIHIQDIANLFVHSIENENVRGPLNGVSPGIVTMKEFSQTLGKVMNRPALFKVPEFMLKIILGEAASSVTRGSKLIPNKTLESGFNFVFNDAEDALMDILSKE